MSEAKEGSVRRKFIASMGCVQRSIGERSIVVVIIVAVVAVVVIVVDVVVAVVAEKSNG